MGFIRGIVVLGIALVLQASLGRFWPGIHRYVDVLLVPVVLFGVGEKQRSAMLVGCASGLLKDTWFQVGAFGVNGFKRTLLGWVLGAVATRFDLNQFGGRLMTGALVAVGDDLLDLAMRGLLDQYSYLPSPLEMLVKAVVTGLLAVAGGAMLDRGQRNRKTRRFG